MTNYLKTSFSYFDIQNRSTAVFFFKSNYYQQASNLGQI